MIIQMLLELGYRQNSTRRYWKETDIHHQGEETFKETISSITVTDSFSLELQENIFLLFKVYSMRCSIFTALTDEYNY